MFLLSHENLEILCKVITGLPVFSKFFRLKYPFKTTLLYSHKMLFINPELYMPNVMEDKEGFMMICSKR